MQQHGQLGGGHPAQLPGGKRTTQRFVPMWHHWLATPSYPQQVDRGRVSIG